MAFNLNVPVLDLNEPVLEDIGFDLNLPLDEYGAVDFDFVQNLTDHADQVNQPKHDYSNHVRQQVYQALLMRSKNGKLGKHDTTIVGDQFGVKIRTVQRIWQQVNVPNRKRGRAGRKAIPLDLEKLREIPLKKRMTIEDVSRELGVSKSKIQRLLRKGKLRRHSSCIKPYLTNENKHTRLKWCIDMIDQGLLDDQKFKDLFDFVFIDEKWFYLHQKYERYYLLPDED
ncbi:hypothetical protein PVAP13_9NG541542 [Panicum virgatum]|uniref:DUF7769 domain-containing protein n=1 Tax=Panicum virgatum TaxID=38727 RepID=A0A8T0MSV4_PANVG|nr:hypothetical protein PVAP13_9NG541542 [Panicum virgatum]